MTTPEIQPWKVNLPEETTKALRELIGAARSCFGGDLLSVVLFGSGAEGRLRPTSDVNLLFVLQSYERAKVDPFREYMRAAHAAARITVMFTLKEELSDAAESFAVKFNDISQRNQLLFGEDLLGSLTISREARIRQLQQVLLNIAMRLRERYAMVGLREEQTALIIADFSGPIRAAAATLMGLEGQSVRSPKEALERFTLAIDAARWKPVLERISQTREDGVLPAGEASGTLFDVMELVAALRSRVKGMV